MHISTLVHKTYTDLSISLYQIIFMAKFSVLYTNSEPEKLVGKFIQIRYHPCLKLFVIYSIILRLEYALTPTIGQGGGYNGINGKRTSSLALSLGM